MLSVGKSKKEVVTEFRQSEILAAARRVFASRGFHDSTIEDVAEAAGIAKGTIYLYYASKLDLYWAALKAGIVAMVEEAERQMAAVATVREKMQAFIASKINYAEAQKDFFRVYFSEFGNALTHPAEMQREFQPTYTVLSTYGVGRCKRAANIFFLADSSSSRVRSRGKPIRLAISSTEART